MASMFLAAAGSGYWSYVGASEDARLVRVDSVVSLPSVDFALTDTQLLFSQSLTALGTTAASEEAKKTNLAATNLGNDDGGQRSIVDFTVQSPSADLAAAAMSRFIGDLSTRVRARHPLVETDQAAELMTRIAEIRGIIQDLQGQPKSSDGLVEGVRKLAIANAFASLAVLEEVKASVRLRSVPDLRVEAPSGPATPIGSNGLRWTRMPIVFTLALGFFVLLGALLTDAVQRLVARRR